MYNKFKGKLVDVALDNYILHGTLIKENGSFLTLLIVNPESGEAKEAIINIKKINYVSSYVNKVEESS